MSYNSKEVKDTPLFSEDINIFVYFNELFSVILSMEGEVFLFFGLFTSFC